MAATYVYLLCAFERWEYDYVIEAHATLKGAQARGKEYAGGMEVHGGVNRVEVTDRQWKRADQPDEWEYALSTTDDGKERFQALLVRKVRVLGG